MKWILMLMLSALVSQGIAQKKKKKDIEAIKSMCGCYDVAFNFAETFAPEEDYKYHENYRAGGLEYVFPIEESKDKIVLQHLLIVGDTMIIKHWRQDWIYENTDFYVFDKDNAWRYVKRSKAEVDDQWTQKVYQVDDGLRYEGSATWVHRDGRSYWEGEADAPLPRREFSKRDDYNVLARRNRHEITDYGWVHEQDNAKISRAGADRLIAREKGWNTYTKTEAEKCNVAVEWWQRKHAYWDDVRAVWDELYAKKQDLAFEKTVDGQPLFKKLFALEDEMLKSTYDRETSISMIKSTIDKYLKGEIALARD